MRHTVKKSLTLAFFYDAAEGILFWRFSCQKRGHVICRRRVWEEMEIRREKIADELLPPVLLQAFAAGDFCLFALLIQKFTQQLLLLIPLQVLPILLQLLVFAG